MNDANSYLKRLAMAFGLLLLTIGCFPLAAAQKEDLYGSRGRVLAEGRNTVEVGEGNFKVTTYSFEEVRLTQPLERVTSREGADGKPRPLEAYEQREVQRFDKVFRLTINGDFPSGSYILWINDAPVRTVNYGSHKIMVVFYNSGGVLEPGATLAVSRYNGKDDLNAPRVVLPESLMVPAELQALQTSQPLSDIKLRRVPDGVDVIVGGSGKFAATNEALVLQIGRQEFLLSRFENGEMTSVIFTLSLEEFASVKDGDSIVLKHGRGISGGQKIGQLNKSLVSLK